MTSRIAIIGAGGWGTALAITLAGAGRDVALWVWEPELAASMKETRENPLYLPGVKVPASVGIHASLIDTVSGRGLLILAVPSPFYRSVVEKLIPLLDPQVVFVSATKGLENGSMMRMSQVIADVSVGHFQPRIAVMSGPTFAPEVARGEPTALVIASTDEDLRRQLQFELSTPRFRLYSNPDMPGVEMGAAVKNIIAMAAGVACGLGLGSNAAAALVTRGLAEITRLVVACGGQRETMSGLAGLGDLVLTSYGNLSRNRQVGIALGQGRTVEEITSGMRMIAEGIRTTKSTVELAHKLKVEMPIAEKMYSMLYEGLNPRTALSDLMERKLKEE
jgi:glycerol-3-phosphate dehydrogenase (NAD(P)+)